MGHIRPGTVNARQPVPGCTWTAWNTEVTPPKSEKQLISLVMYKHLVMLIFSREEAGDSKPSGGPLANPFSSADDDRR